MSTQSNLFFVPTAKALPAKRDRRLWGRTRVMTKNAILVQGALLTPYRLSYPCWSLRKGCVGPALFPTWPVVKESDDDDDDNDDDDDDSYSQ